jgi:IS605 OrfB family transposase
LVSNVYSAIFAGKSTEQINEIYKRGSRNPKEDDPDYSLYKYDEIKFPKGLPSASTLKMKAKNDMKTAKEKGLYKGHVSLQNRKLDAPLWIESANFSFYHDEYDSYNDFLDDLMDGNVNVYMKFVNNIIFKVVFGNPYRSHEMRCVFQNIFEGTYVPKGSSIQFDKSGKKILLNLSLEIPVKKNVLDENITVGVNMRGTEPALCVLNTESAHATFGSREHLLRVKTQMKAQRRSLQKALKYTAGGHGRKKKLNKLEVFEHHEANFVKTYQHKVSKDIVDFAVDNHAKYINIENLSGYHENEESILHIFPYYNLTAQIKYKAAIQGIEVREIPVCDGENDYDTACNIANYREKDAKKS